MRGVFAWDGWASPAGALGVCAPDISRYLQILSELRITTIRPVMSCHVLSFIALHCTYVEIIRIDFRCESCALYFLNMTAIKAVLNLFRFHFRPLSCNDVSPRYFILFHSDPCPAGHYALSACTTHLSIRMHTAKRLTQPVMPTVSNKDDKEIRQMLNMFFLQKVQTWYFAPLPRETVSSMCCQTDIKQNSTEGRLF